MLEKEQTIASMQRQIEELKRKAEQGSQQLQGEVQELELESLLAAKFPFDTIEPVPKGEFGGDVLQRVLRPAGQLRHDPLGVQADEELDRRLARQTSRRPTDGEGGNRDHRLTSAQGRDVRPSTASG